MNVRKIGIGLLLILLVGVSVNQVVAIQLCDINYMLEPVGGRPDSMATGDFYLQAGDILHILVQTDGNIGIQIRGNAEPQEWNYTIGEIDLYYVIPSAGPYYVYFENLDSTRTSIIGGVFLNDEGDTTTTPEPTGPTGPDGDGRGFNILDFLIIVYVIAGVLFIISLIVWRRRKGIRNFKFLIDFDDDELLPSNWNPDEEIEEEEG